MANDFILRFCPMPSSCSLRLLEFQNSHSFELRDSVSGSVLFSEFRRFERLRRIHPHVINCEMKKSQQAL